LGAWSVIVRDTDKNENTGTFTDWRLNLWGEAADGAKQELHPLPEENDDDHPYEDAHVATTTLEATPTKTVAPANPDDHHDRPVNAKPQETSTKPEPTPDTKPETKPVEDEKKPNPTAGGETASPSPTSSDYISSYLPTFGTSKRTQAWIYASFAMIVVFFIGLGVYFQLQRVKRRRTTAHDDYEFEMIEDEDEMQPMTGASGRTQRRGGELYNAFAGESDEEMFSDDDEPYRDGLANIPEKTSEDGSSHGGRQEKP
jgi:kexin